MTINDYLDGSKNQFFIIMIMFHTLYEDRVSLSIFAYVNVYIFVNLFN